MTNQAEGQTVGQEWLIKILAGATFLIFFQAYMVAPLIPSLALEFSVSNQIVGLVVPAYMIPYGLSTLFYGLLSDRIGRRRIMLASLIAFIVLTALTATAQSSSQMIFWRFLTGVGASGVVPLGLALIGQNYPFEKRGRPLGWLFGAMAGGMAFGSTFGAILQPIIGWRGTFLAVSVMTTLVFLLLLPRQKLLGERPPSPLFNVRVLFSAYSSFLAPGRGLRTYLYVFLNSIFHSGVYTWLGVYFSQRFGLSEMGIGLALLGYGIPGFLFGPKIGHMADQYGRRWLIPAGLGIAATSAVLLSTDVPLVVAALAVTLLSLGYDMTQPLFAGIVTAIAGQRGGQAMGLNVFLLFSGLGIGSFVFGEFLRLGISSAFLVFGGFQLVAALSAFKLFRSETAKAAD